MVAEDRKKSTRKGLLREGRASDERDGVKRKGSNERRKGGVRGQREVNGTQGKEGRDRRGRDEGREGEELRKGKKTAGGELKRGGLQRMLVAGVMKGLGEQKVYNEDVQRR